MCRSGSPWIAASSPAVGGAAMVPRSELAPLRQVLLLPETLPDGETGAEHEDLTES